MTTEAQEAGDMSTMRAACVHRYGGLEEIQLQEVQKPTPGRGEVLIRVVASTVNSADWRLRSMDVPRGYRTVMRLVIGFSGPKQPILGTELAGVVEELGAEVETFRVGDAVIAVPGIGLGAHAEYKVMPAAKRVIPKPDALSFVEASAMCFGGLTALHFLREKAKLQPGERLLVIGASGTVGTAAIQLAREFGADITAVCSGGNAEIVTGLGAARVIDYTKEDFRTMSDSYDVIADCVGGTPYGHVHKILRPGGRLLRIVADLPGELGALFRGRLGGHRVFAGTSTERTEDMQYLADLAARGRYRPVIDRTFPLDQVREAHALVQSRRKRGSVVLEVSPAP